MIYLFDKFILFILCVLLLPQYTVDFYMVIASLAAIAVSCLCYYLKKSNLANLLLSLFCISVLLVPIAGMFLPVIMYDIVCNRKILPKISGLIGLCAVVYQVNLLTALMICSFVAVSTILAYRSEKISNIEKRLKETRDSGIELQILLKQKNRDLVEKQDYEIHMATLQERNRIAREIHDNVGHLLTRSILQVGALKAVNHDKAVCENLNDLNETLNLAMTNIRTGVHDLHDEAIDLHTALGELIERMTQPEIKLDYDMGMDIPKNIKYSFVAIVREALNNVTKHSNATIVNITVREHPGFYQLLIEDNGTNIHTSLNGGIGLANMHERVESLNGTLKVSTEKGFSIFITIMKEG